MRSQEKIFLGALLAISIAVVVIVNIVFWRWNYSSDTALIGLMANSLVNRAEIPGFFWPVFVWSVGYQGILLEVYSGALALWLGGFSPSVLNTVPAFFFVLFIGLFVQAVKESYGLRVALWAALFVTISTPMFYWSVLRTLPNYGETFSMGCALVLVYLRILRTVGKPEQSKWVAAFGFLIGFGLYTYQQIIYFIGAIFLHAVVVVAKKAKDGGLRISPPRWLMAGVLTLIGALIFIFQIERIDWLGQVEKWNPGPVLKVLTGASALIVAWPWMRSLSKSERVVWVRSFAWGGLFYLLGRLPVFYHTFVLKQAPQSKLAMSGGVDAILFRLEMVVRGLGRFWNFSVDRPLSWCALLFFCLAVAYCLQKVVRDVRKFWKASGNPSLEFVSPFVFLPLVAIPAFMTSLMVVDIDSARYIIVVLLFSGVAAGDFLDRMVRDKSVIIATAIGLSVLTLNAAAVYRDFSEVPSRLPVEEIADFLEAEGIREAYTDYWYGYALSFATEERIAVEPTTSKYNPYYGARVKAAARVAYIESHKPDRPQLPVTNGQMVFDGLSYRVTRTEQVGGAEVRILEKI